MNEEGPSQSPVEELPEIAIEKRRGISVVWLIPLVAAIIGAWLTYKTITEMGLTITITFKDGGGLEAGKTKIKYKSVQVGEVEGVDISEDLSHVTVMAKMGKAAEPHLTENTKFWVVRPRIGFGGISGLETLVSGAYIEIDPRPGPLIREFKGLEKPPGVKFREAGSQFTLRAQKLGSLSAGSPIYFRDIEVGEVVGHELAKDDQSVLIHIFVRAPHHLRIRDTSRFWKTSGIEVSVGAEGLDLKMGSLATLIAGGVTFDTPVTAGGASEPSKAGTAFELFESFASMGEARYVRKVPYLIHFDGSVRGLSVGAPVEFKGIKVGSVTDIAARFDPKTLDVQIPVIIEIEPERISTPDVIASQKPYEAGAIMVKRGLRAQLQTGSLLTGQLFVELELYPKLPRKQLIMTGKYPELPTVPSTMDEFRRTVTDVLAELRRMPLDKIAQELLETMKGANRLANAPELMESVRTLDATLKDFQKLTRNVDQTIVSLASSTEKTLAAGRRALQVADPNSPAAIHLENALKELSAAARAIRVLANYLEQHPEAVLVGKSGRGG